eukprot:jgi/Tetstr1/427245/TSEL_017432.t1
MDVKVGASNHDPKGPLGGWPSGMMWKPWSASRRRHTVSPMELDKKGVIMTTVRTLAPIACYRKLDMASARTGA